MVAKDQKYGNCVTIKQAIADFYTENGNENKVYKSAFRAAKVNSLYKQAICEIYGKSAFLILENTNAVYIIRPKDKKFRTFKTQANNDLQLCIYTCDSMVHADLDSRQEFIKIWFNNNNEKIDTMKLYSSKLSMRHKFPFKDYAEKLKNMYFGSDITSGSNFNDLRPQLDNEQINSLLEHVSEIKNIQLKNSLNEALRAYNVC